MELEIDKRIYVPIQLLAVLLVILGIGWGIMQVMGFVGEAVTPKSYNPDTQMKYLNWSICDSKDAIQMYQQNPASTHPSVVKLKSNIALYDEMAGQMDAAKFSIAWCG